MANRIVPGRIETRQDSVSLWLCTVRAVGLQGKTAEPAQPCSCSYWSRSLWTGCVYFLDHVVAGEGMLQSTG